MLAILEPFESIYPAGPTESPFASFAKAHTAKRTKGSRDKNAKSIEHLKSFSLALEDQGRHDKISFANKKEGVRFTNKSYWLMNVNCR